MDDSFRGLQFLIVVLLCSQTQGYGILRNPNCTQDDRRCVHNNRHEDTGFNILTKIRQILKDDKVLDEHPCHILQKMQENHGQERLEQTPLRDIQSIREKCQMQKRSWEGSIIHRNMDTATLWRRAILRYFANHQVNPRRAEPEALVSTEQEVEVKRSWEGLHTAYGKRLDDELGDSRDLKGTHATNSRSPEESEQFGDDSAKRSWESVHNYQFPSGKRSWEGIRLAGLRSQGTTNLGKRAYELIKDMDDLEDTRNVSQIENGETLSTIDAILNPIKPETAPSRNFALWLNSKLLPEAKTTMKKSWEGSDTCTCCRNYRNIYCCIRCNRLNAETEQHVDAKSTPGMLFVLNAVCKCCSETNLKDCCELCSLLKI